MFNNQLDGFADIMKARLTRIGSWLPFYFVLRTILLRSSWQHPAANQGNETAMSPVIIRQIFPIYTWEAGGDKERGEKEDDKIIKRGGGRRF